MVRALFRRWPIAWSLVAINAGVVCLVYKAWLSAEAAVQRYDDPALMWLWLLILDFPMSLLVEVMHPRYGIQSGTRFLYTWRSSVVYHRCCGRFTFRASAAWHTNHLTMRWS